MKDYSNNNNCLISILKKIDTIPYKMYPDSVKDFL